MARVRGFWCGVVLATLLSAPVLAQDVTADTVIATVNGTDIRLGHMIVLRDSLPAQYQELPDDVLFKGILEQLIQQEALEKSYPKLSQRDSLTLENERRTFLSGLALQAVVAGAVTDASLQAAYDARFADAAPQTEYNAAHILVDTEEQAADLKSQIDSGADFAELAIANSKDGAAQNGGDLGWFGIGMMVKPFEDAVLAMQPGEVAGPIKTDFGFHLVLLKETRIANAPTLDDLRDELAAEIEQAAVSAHIKSLTDAATITRPGEGIDPGAIRDATLLSE